MVQEEPSNSLGDVFDGVITRVSLALYVLMILVVGIQILTRWIIEPLFQESLPWTVNLSQLLLVYVTFIGAAVASAKREHISLDLLVTRLSDRSIRILFAFRTLLSAAFVIVMMVGAYPLYQSNKGFSIGGLPAYPPFTEAWLYVPLLVGGLLILIYAFRDLGETVLYPEKILTDVKREEIDDE